MIEWTPLPAGVYGDQNGTPLPTGIGRRKESVNRYQRGAEHKMNEWSGGGMCRKCERIIYGHSTITLASTILGASWSCSSPWPRRPSLPSPQVSTLFKSGASRGGCSTTNGWRDGGGGACAERSGAKGREQRRQRRIQGGRHCRRGWVWVEWTPLPAMRGVEG